MKLHWIHTSDVHGSLDRLCGIEQHVNRLRVQHGASNVILTDGGDILQGHILCYYHNVINPSLPHAVAEVMNRMHYDAVAVGNHDIETGHKVYDRVFSELSFPVLSANILSTSDFSPYFQPYTIVNKGGMRIAIVSVVTPSTQSWISPSQYTGLSFAEPIESIRQCLAHIKRGEDYDVLVGIFHTGWAETGNIVCNIGDFDFVLYGHDHHEAIHRVGKTICAAPSSQATSFVSVEIDTETRRIDAAITKSLDEGIPSIYEGFPDFETWRSTPIATLTSDLHEFDSYFGPSAYLSVIHRMQLAATGAQVSLACPLVYDTVIRKGVLTNNDIFTLYNRDSQLYTVRLTGEELRSVLERSYSIWCNTMTYPNDHALLLDYVLDNGTRLGLKHFIIDFLTAAGIDYIVNLTKPVGEKVRFVNSPLDEYTVAVNSYHYNGGGNIFPDATGLSHEELQQRIIKIEPYDIRHCIATEMHKLGIVDATPLNNWRFVPDEWAQPALLRDREILTTGR